VPFKNPPQVDKSDLQIVLGLLGGFYKTVFPRPLLLPVPPTHTPFPITVPRRLSSVHPMFFKPSFRRLLFTEYVDGMVLRWVLELTANDSAFHLESKFGKNAILIFSRPPVVLPTPS